MLCWAVSCLVSAPDAPMDDRGRETSRGQFGAREVPVLSDHLFTPKAARLKGLGNMDILAWLSPREASSHGGSRVN